MTTNTDETLRTLIEQQERERQLVAYEIHDGLAQYLSAAIMHLEAYEAGLPNGPGSVASINEVLRLLRQATSETRHLIAGLRPPALDELGIIEAINALVADARLEINEVNFSHSLQGDRLPPETETALFRMVQESLTNIRRHAAASVATLHLATEPDGSIVLQITDDGCGFDPEAIGAQKFGLEGIRQRAAILGGSVQVQSKPGTGTTIEIRLPPPTRGHEN
jgi:signal transduction histidine kinase